MVEPNGWCVRHKRERAMRRFVKDDVVPKHLDDVRDVVRPHAIHEEKGDAERARGSGSTASVAACHEVSSAPATNPARTLPTNAGTSRRTASSRAASGATSAWLTSATSARASALAARATSSGVAGSSGAQAASSQKISGRWTTSRTGRHDVADGPSHAGRAEHENRASRARGDDRLPGGVRLEGEPARAVGLHEDVVREGRQRVDAQLWCHELAVLLGPRSHADHARRRERLRDRARVR